MEFTIIFYKDSSGKSPIEEFLIELAKELEVARERLAEKKNI